MVNPLDEKRRIDLANCAREKLGYKRAAGRVGCSLPAARRWMRRWKAEHSVMPRPHKGRLPVLTAEQQDTALDLLTSRRFMGAWGVARELQAMGVTATVLSGDTVIKGAKAAAKRAGYRIRFWRGKLRERLNPEHKGARLMFAQRWLKRPTGMVVFSDRKMFTWHHPGSKLLPCCWLREKEVVEASFASSRKGVNVYCALTPFGLTNIHMVTGTHGLVTKYKTQQGKKAKGINKWEYMDVLSKTLLPGAARLMQGAWGKTWVFMQDGDKAHGGGAAAIAAYNQRAHTRVQLLTPWPARSCDLNPIEHIWAYVQRKLNARGCKTFQEFKSAVGQEMRRVPQSLISALYASMPRRLAAVIEAEGGRTRY